MQRIFKKVIASFLLVTLVFITAHSVFVTEAAEALPPVCSAPKDEEQKKQCEQLVKAEKEYEQAIKELQEAKKNVNTTQDMINVLEKNVKTTQSDIQKKSAQITAISKDISNKSNTIAQLSSELDREKSSLAQIIRKKNELDNYTLFEYLLSSENVSEFYGDADSFDFIQGSLAESFNDIVYLQGKTDAERRALMERRNQENDVKYSLEQSKKDLENQKSEQTKVKTAYEKEAKTKEQLAAQRKAEADSIRAALVRFQGSGITARSISFGEAYDYAKIASTKTGVRPAFIMAIMQQETGFGNNVGGCNVRQRPTTSDVADGIYIKSGNPSRKTMIPSNFDNFVSITTSLGMDWKTTPVSCALIQSDGSLYGYGGAMGYTQFIPNTWMAVAARVKSFLGLSRAASPWEPRDAVMATAVFMMDQGASAQTYSVEYNAACRYYGSCSSYATSVMNKATAIQTTINQLEKLND